MVENKFPERWEPLIPVQPDGATEQDVALVEDQEIISSPPYGQEQLSRTCEPSLHLMFAVGGEGGVGALTVTSKLPGMPQRGLSVSMVVTHCAL